MEEKREVKNNVVFLRGTVVGDLWFDHEVLRESFYCGYIRMNRLSEEADTLIFTISERDPGFELMKDGARVEVKGQIRSYNEHNQDGKNRLKLSVFVTSVEELPEGVQLPDENYVILDGYVCKHGGVRKTPKGRKIADVTLAVNRVYGKSDYIPLIFWGRSADYVGSRRLGTNLKLKGRFQSREYNKKIDENNIEKRVAYEVSVISFEDTGETLERKERAAENVDNAEKVSADA